MEELLYFIFGLLAEALGLKPKKPVVPPAPLSPAAPRRPLTMPPQPGLAPVPQSGSTAQRAAPRRPDAGGPAVDREATTASFDAQEAALLLTEPRPLELPRAPTISPKEAAPALFANSSDLVRAVVLQEALGPPLCRRQPPR